MMNTSFFILFLLLLPLNSQNDYHNLLNRYHELMNEELLDESPRSLPEREGKEGTSIVPHILSFHSHSSQSLDGLHGGDMRLPRGLLIRLVIEGEKRKTARQLSRVVRQ